MSHESKAPTRGRTNITRREAFAATIAALVAIPGLRAGPVAAAIPLMRDRAGRLLLEAQLDGRGPFRFLLDTGAAVSAVSDFLAAELRLLPAAGPPDTILGATGDTRLARVQAREIRVDRLRIATPVLARLPAAGRVDTEFDGVLGADLLRAARARARLWMSPGRAELIGAEPIDGGEPPSSRDRDAGLHEIDVVRRQGPLLAVRVRFRAARSVEVAGILDTGAQRSIGNLALRAALRLGTGSAAAAVVRGAGGQVVAAHEIESPPLGIGPARLPARALLYADLPVFAAWGWSQRPALLLGMDLLSSLASLSLDYRRRRVALAPAPDLA